MTTTPPPLQLTVPSPRRSGTYAVALVCLGNICRSPMADVVLSARLAEAGLADVVEVSSCGTGGWHVGEPMDARAAATLRDAGLDPERHRAQQWSPDWLERHDLVLAMDRSNLDDLGAPVGAADGPDARVGNGAGNGADNGAGDQVRLFGDFDPLTPRAEVPDPYYGGPDGFTDVLAMVERTCDVLVAAISTRLAADARTPAGSNSDAGPAR